MSSFDYHSDSENDWDAFYTFIGKKVLFRSTLKW